METIPISKNQLAKDYQALTTDQLKSKYGMNNKHLYKLLKEAKIPLKRSPKDRVRFDLVE